MSVQLLLHVAGAVLGAYLVIEARFDGFTAKQHALELEVVRISNDRFTAQDGKSVWEAIYEIRSQIVTNDPPDWFVERIDRIESRLERLDSIERRLDRLETKIEGG